MSKKPTVIKAHCPDRVELTLIILAFAPPIIWGVLDWLNWI